MSEPVRVKYKASPTGAKFHASNKRVRGIMGPIGSGKSVTCVWEIMRRSCRQKPNQAGIRRTRWAIVRNTYPELKSTTIKTWLDWFPEEHFGPVKWDIPITHKFRFDLGDGTMVEMEVIFLALDRPKDVKKLLSLEVTGIWFNEAREIELNIIEAGDGRHGRFPSQKDEGCSWHGMIMDTNPPDDTHWWYIKAEEDTPETWDMFRQPGGLIKVGPNEYVGNPDAENLQNLPAGYYTEAWDGKTEDHVRVYYCGEYGTLTDGKPVYPEYNDSVHGIDGNLLVLRRSPLKMGWDFGLNPSVVFFQISPRGQLRAIDELVADGMGLRQFLEQVVMPHIHNNYKGMKLEGYGDPAGVARSETDEQTCFGVLADFGLFLEPAPSNKFARRRDAVAQFLTRMVDGAPAMVVSKKCKLLKKGFRGAYQYRRLQVPGDARYRLEPDKTLVSHPHDAFQYGVLGSLPETTPRQAPVRTQTYRPVSGAGY